MSLIFRDIIVFTQGVTTNRYCLEEFGFSVEVTRSSEFYKTPRLFYLGRGRERPRNPGTFSREGSREEELLVIFQNPMPTAPFLLESQRHLYLNTHTAQSPTSPPTCFVTKLGCQSALSFLLTVSPQTSRIVKIQRP